MSVRVETHFKGWAKPGVVPPGARQSDDAAQTSPAGAQASGSRLRASGSDLTPGVTLDAISGHFRIFQLKQGHRFSTDDVLTAWYGTSWCPSASHVLDLGSGIGSVGMIAAWRLPGAQFVTIEAQDDSVALARRSAAYNGLDGRYEIRHADLRDPGVLRDDERFDLILGSPPYFPLGTGMEGDHPQKVACRFELRGDIGDYARVAAGHLAAGGLFACVFPEDQRERLERAARVCSLVVIRRRPVVFREGDDPIIGLFAMMRASDLPERMHGRTWVEPPLVIRSADGGIHPEYAAVKLAIGFPP